FGLLAWPERYGASGVNAFVVNQSGRGYEKDLGPETEALAGGIETFDPGPTWRAGEKIRISRIIKGELGESREELRCPHVNLLIDVQLYPPGPPLRRRCVPLCFLNFHRIPRNLYPDSRHAAGA